MAADVSALFRILSRDDGGSGGETVAPKRFLVTRDLLGESSRGSHEELDLDLQVPLGWEKRLDLKSGKVFLQRTATSSSPPTPKRPSLQDLNFPPNPTAQILPDASSSLDLKLSPSALDYQSVHTLEKVKSALERAKNRPSPRATSATTTNASSPSISASTTTTTSETSIRGGHDEEERPGPSDLMFAAGCPGCLMYVLISRRNPKCPRCEFVVPNPTTTARAFKKPKLDLNGH
ncbi:hypothetical protein QJS04_geneDACA018875 [Acorus gramineus]|uniref:GIR1-like zinc ribbon domain-containing protein n=1 Tax=Acorus gramineus TaxID=55184 RepID=A0AAV9BRZ8_ACOGR|nr:hypothetical protein QJS04_geneDACA018875 [Acorus gramineus]